MAPSQLKKLKASLRESGVVGPQKSKKQKKQASKNGTLREGRIQRNEALNSIREKFAPFEVKAPVRNKFEFVSRNGVAGKASKGVVGRPGVTKGLGEENVRWFQYTFREHWLIKGRSADEPCYLKCNDGTKSAVFAIGDLGRVTRP